MSPGKQRQRNRPPNVGIPTRAQRPTPTEFYATFAAAIRKARESLRFTRRELALQMSATDADLMAQCIYKYERGHSRIPLHVARVLAQALQQSLDGLCESDSRRAKLHRLVALMPAEKLHPALRLMESLTRTD